MHHFDELFDSYLDANIDLDIDTDKAALKVSASVVSLVSQTGRHFHYCFSMFLYNVYYFITSVLATFL